MRELNEEELVREAVTGEVIDSDYTWEEIEEPILILDTPDEIEMYRILAIRKALQLEVTTGMRFSKGKPCLVARQGAARQTETKQEAGIERNE